jgi:hypothetical protein
LQTSQGQTAFNIDTSGLQVGPSLSLDDLAFDEFINYDGVLLEDQSPKPQLLVQPTVRLCPPHATNNMRLESLETVYQRASHDARAEVIQSHTCLSIGIGGLTSQLTDFSPGSSLDQNNPFLVQDLGQRQEKKQKPPKDCVVVFSANPNDESIHRRGKLNASRRQEVEKIRKARACIQCKSRKIPVRSRKLTNYLNSDES